MAVGLPAKTTYADGDVFSASDINDTNGTLNLVGQTTNFYAGKNKVINGDFGIWQRGTSFSTNNVYTADRWYVTGDGSPTFTLSQQTFTAGTAPVAGYEGQYFARYAVTSAGGSTYRQLQQQIEDVRTFAGQTITISFWARINSGTVTGNYVRWNQVFGSGGSATVNGSSNNFTLTSSWQRFTVTTSVTSISGKTIGTSSYLGIDFVLPFTTTMSVDFWGVQVEAGSTATAFQTATGTIQGELAACQRYYYRLPALTASNRYLGNGMAWSATASMIGFTYPVTMRIRPTALEQSGTAADYATVRSQSSTDNCTAVPVYSVSTSSSMGWVSGTSANLVAGNATMFYTNNTNAYLAWSAEL
jgi:hypothetical protein